MKDKAIKDAMNSIENRIRHVYNQGYEDGKESVQIDDSTTYERGLNDAWEYARKIYSLSAGEIINIFGGCSTWVNYSVSEAIAKIKEYEEKQKRNCDTCKYGGHTLQDLKKCIYCDGRNGWTPKMTLDEAIKHCEEVADSKCDECGAEHRQLAEWLKELKELKEDEERKNEGRNENEKME